MPKSIFGISLSMIVIVVIAIIVGKKFGGMIPLIKNV